MVEDKFIIYFTYHAFKREFDMKRQCFGIIFLAAAFMATPVLANTDTEIAQQNADPNQLSNSPLSIAEQTNPVSPVQDQTNINATSVQNQNTANTEIEGKMAGGESQITVIDENGNLKVVDTKKKPTTGATPTGTNLTQPTTPGLIQQNPTVAPAAPATTQPALPGQTLPHANVPLPANPAGTPVLPQNPPAQGVSPNPITPSTPSSNLPAQGIPPGNPPIQPGIPPINPPTQGVPTPANPSGQGLPSPSNSPSQGLPVPSNPGQAIPTPNQQPTLAPGVNSQNVANDQFNAY